ncbi:hypothetical protein N8917_00595 [bacterium]|nr:hypothetical protein [bacterium]
MGGVRPDDLEEEEWYAEWDEDDFDDSWGGTFLSGSDDPPGEVYGSDFGDDSSEDALLPEGFYTPYNRPGEEEDDDE